MQHWSLKILNNLLGNAAKFTARGHISVGAGWRDESRQQVAVYVLDSGIGIPKHKLSSIFLPFEQVSGGRLPDSSSSPTLHTWGETVDGHGCLQTPALLHVPG